MTTIHIPGLPQQQGSKNQAATGHMYDANKNLAPWRSAAIYAIRAAHRGDKITGPVSVDATFLFPRPKAHYGTGRNAGKVKPTAPIWCASKPDTDKLQRALGDALAQSGMLRDDAQIVEWGARKWYTANAPETIVSVVEL